LNVSGSLPIKYISSVIFSSADENTIYVSYTGYRDNDNTPYIYKSGNLGQNWSPIQGDMPLIAINNILELPADKVSPDGVLVIATDAGVYISKNNGRNWSRLGSNMPYVTVYDVDYNPALNQVVAGTFGRSIMSFDLDQINYPSTTFTTDVSNVSYSVYPTLIQQGQDIRIATHVQDLTFEIFDANGRVVAQEIKANQYLTYVNTNTLWPGLYFVKPKHLKAKATRFVKI